MYRWMNVDDFPAQGHAGQRILDHLHDHDWVAVTVQDKVMLESLAPIADLAALDSLGVKYLPWSGG